MSPDPLDQTLQVLQEASYNILIIISTDVVYKIEELAFIVFWEVWNRVTE